MPYFYCAICAGIEHQPFQLINGDEDEKIVLPDTRSKVTNIVAEKLSLFANADVANLSKLITSYLDPGDYVITINYHTNITDIPSILHFCEHYSSHRYDNYSGILTVNLEFYCNCRIHKARSILPRGTFIPRMYFERNGDLIIDTSNNRIVLPKKRIPVMATSMGKQVVKAIVIRN